MKNRLRVLRAEHRLSQADVAERVGVARQTIHAVENDKFSPSLTLAFRIASLFGANINDVFAPDPGELVQPLTEAYHVGSTLASEDDDGDVRPRALLAPRGRGRG